MRIVNAERPAQVAVARELILEYANGLGVDLNPQGFAEEVAGLPGAYAPPRGRLLLALAGPVPVACVALRPLGEGVCEMKRLYVRPRHRGHGIGERMARAVLAEARAIGYRRMRLDTLPKLEAATALYRRLGFRTIPPYYDNPIAGTVFFEQDL